MAGVSFLYNEASAIWLLITALFSGALFFASRFFKPKDTVFFAKEGLVTVALSWIILSLIGALPFFLSKEIPSYVDSLFETASGFSSGASLFDAKRNTYTKANKDASVSLTRDDGIAHIYIEFDRTPSVWTITDNESGVSYECGKYGFLHEYVNVTELFGTTVKSLKLSFPEGTVIADIYGFSEGTLPDFVQMWNPPCEKADILILTTHSDDEQLFFSGALPYYSIERKLQVQIAYGVQHFEANGVKDHVRPHEQIDGLWTVGIRNYPVMSDIPDLYADSLQQAIANFGSQGVTQDDSSRRSS